MKLTDVIALAKAGYKKADIEELLSIQVDEPDPEPAPDSTEPEIPAEGAGDTSPEVPDGPDYEQMFNDTMKELEKVKNDLKVAQAQNTSRNVSGFEPNDPWKDLEEIARSYM